MFDPELYPDGYWVAPAVRSIDADDAPTAHDGQLERRLVIERAKGALMLACGLTDADAIAFLRRFSHHRDIELHVVAQQFTASLSGGPGKSGWPTDADQLLEGCLWTA